MHFRLTQTTDKHAPLKKLTRKQKRLQRRPWITKGFLISVKHKQRMYIPTILRILHKATT